MQNNPYWTKRAKLNTGLLLVLMAFMAVAIKLMLTDAPLYLGALGL